MGSVMCYLRFGVSVVDNVQFAVIIIYQTEEEGKEKKGPLRVRYVYIWVVWIISSFASLVFCLHLLARLCIVRKIKAWLIYVCVRVYLVNIYIHPLALLWKIWYRFLMSDITFTFITLTWYRWVSYITGSLIFSLSVLIVSRWRKGNRSKTRCDVSSNFNAIRKHHTVILSSQSFYFMCDKNYSFGKSCTYYCLTWMMQ